MIERWIPHYQDFAVERLCTPVLPSPVGIRHFCVTDNSRADGGRQRRRFMASIFYPAANDDGDRAGLVDILEPCVDAALQLVVPDMPDMPRDETRAVLRSLTLHARRDVPACAYDGRSPLLIYYPAGESTRIANAAVCEKLAAAGYIVAALDGPRDAPVVVYPDGKIALQPMRKNESYVTPRVADVRCLLDALTDEAFAGLDACAIDPRRIGLFGNSRGGYLSNICAVEDPRIQCAANMDGFLWGFWTAGTGLNRFPAEFQARARALKTPILRVSAAMESREAAEQKFLAERDDFGGAFALAALNGFSHGSFSTTPYLSKQPEAALAALDRAEPPAFAAAAVCAGLLDAFFSAALNRTDDALSANWPPIDGFLFER